MIFIGVIFLVIIAIFIYIYGGLKLGENIKGETEYTLFWVAYCLFGITIGICILLVFIWGDIHKKVGPPGPRGYMGDDGDEGTPGECNASHTLLGIMYKIREAIANKDGMLTEDGKLVNKYMESRLQTIITSNQLKVLLESNERVNDITGYLVGIWKTWANGIQATKTGSAFFTTPDALPDFSEEIQNYFTTEIEKYDIWYWGSTPVFRPLEAEICRKLTVPNPATGKLEPNSNMPLPDRPEIDFIEIEYSDTDTSNLIITYNSAGITPAEPKKAKRWKSIIQDNKGMTAAGTISQPIFAIPKPVKRGQQQYYPIGQVVLESNPAFKTNKKKKTILVSGDIILPNMLELVWSDTADSTTKNKKDQGQAAVVPGLFYRVSTNVPGYVCLGDLFLSSTDINSTKLLADITTKDVMNYLGYNSEEGKILGEYKGIVCVPNKCLEKVEDAAIPSWSYKDTIIYESEIPEETYNIVRAGTPEQSDSNNNNISLEHYKILDKCTLSLEDVPIKALEAQFNELGIGWFGHPIKNNQKYSIFSFLGIMPEGIIVHRNSGRKYYIKHYGGKDMNKYLLVKWDNDRKDYLQTLKAISADIVQVENSINPADEEQQWSIIPAAENRNYFRITSVAFPNKYLSLDYNINPGWNRHSKPLDSDDTSLAKMRPKGISVSHQTVIAKLVFNQGALNASNKTLFYDIPAYGVNFNINEQQKTLENNKKGNPAKQNNYKYLLGMRNIDTTTDRNNPGAELKYT